MAGWLNWLSHSNLPGSNSKEVYNLDGAHGYLHHRLMAEMNSVQLAV